MIEIILEDIVGGVDIAGVEIFMEGQGVIDVHPTTGSGGRSVVQTGGRDKTLASSGLISGFVSLTSFQQIRSLLSVGINDRTISSQSSMSRAMISSGASSRLETGTLRS